MTVRRVVRWAFYLFICSLPFEYPPRTIPWEVTTITAAVFLLAALVQPRLLFARIPWAARWFGLYLYAFLVAFALNSAEYDEEVWRLFTLLLETALLMVAAANVLREEDIRRTALRWLVVACVVRAGIQLAGISVSTHVEWTGGERISALGQNANHSAMILTAGLLALLSLAYDRPIRGWRRGVLLWGPAAAITIAIVQNASRGAMVALGAGLVAFTFGGRTAGTRVRNALLATFAFIAIAFASYLSPTMRNRFADSASTGFMAGRERIFPVAWQMAVERPLAGWGPTRNKYELGSRLPEQHRPRRDTHNLVLEVITSTGLLGLIPFAVGTALSLLAAWRARRGSEGILPLAFLVAVLAANLSGNWIAAPILWLAFGYAMASAATVPAPVAAPWRYRRSRVTAGVGTAAAHLHN